MSGTAETRADRTLHKEGFSFVGEVLSKRAPPSTAKGFGRRASQKAPQGRAATRSRCRAGEQLRFGKPSSGCCVCQPEEAQRTGLLGGLTEDLITACHGRNGSSCSRALIFATRAKRWMSRGEPARLRKSQARAVGASGVRVSASDVTRPAINLWPTA